jgi:hypothetical protein
MNLDLLDETYSMVKSKLYFVDIDHIGLTGGTHRSDRSNQTCQFWVRTKSFRPCLAAASAIPTSWKSWKLHRTDQLLQATNSCKSHPLHYKRTSPLGGASRAFPLTHPCAAAAALASLRAGSHSSSPLCSVHRRQSELSLPCPLPSAVVVVVPPLGAGRRRPSPRLKLPSTEAPSLPYPPHLLEIPPLTAMPFPNGRAYRSSVTCQSSLPCHLELSLPLTMPAPSSLPLRAAPLLRSSSLRAP